MTCRTNTAQYTPTRTHTWATAHTHYEQPPLAVIINKSTAAPAPSPKSAVSRDVDCFMCGSKKQKRTKRMWERGRPTETGDRRPQQVGVTYHFLTGFDLWTLPKIKWRHFLRFKITHTHILLTHMMRGVFATYALRTRNCFNHFHWTNLITWRIIQNSMQNKKKQKKATIKIFKNRISSSCMQISRSTRNTLLLYFFNPFRKL